MLGGGGDEGRGRVVLEGEEEGVVDKGMEEGFCEVGRGGGDGVEGGGGLVIKGG